MTAPDIGDYIASHVQDPISRTAGVGDYQLFGSQYAMRIWLDPAKLNNFGLTTDDVASALQAQNVQVAAGELGGLPSVKGQRLNATIIGPQWLQKPEQFEQILLRVNTNGSRVLLRDVARVELGAENYSVSTKYNGLPATGLAIKLAPGANALETRKAITATLERLEPFFPPGLKAVYPFDTTPFVKISIEEVVKTLFEAIVLVFLVMYLFLQNFRATLIPTIAVPVVLLGTFAILAVAGFSINTLTMFGMVLAIGLLVDDAIVVVENVERVMEEERALARGGGAQIDEPDHRRPGRHRAGAVGGVPADGLLRRLDGRHLPAVLHHHRLGHGVVGDGRADPDAGAVRHAAQAARTGARRVEASRRLFRLVQPQLSRMNHGYARSVGHVTRRTGRYLLVYVVIAVPDGRVVRADSEVLPAGRGPGRIVRAGSRPAGYARGGHRAGARPGARPLSEGEMAVNSVFTVSGFSFGGHGQSAGLAFVSLKGWGRANGVRATIP